MNTDVHKLIKNKNKKGVILDESIFNTTTEVPLIDSEEEIETLDVDFNMPTPKEAEQISTVERSAI